MVCSVAASPRSELVGGLVQQRLQRRVLQRLRRVRVVEYLLKGRVDALRLPDLFHRAAVVPCVSGRGLLRPEDERLHRSHVRKAVVALHVPEDDVEEPERRPGGEEVVHVGVPRAVEARHERETRVVVEEHKSRLVDRADRDAVVPWPIPGRLLQVAERSPQRLAPAGLDTEEQAELARRPDADAGAGSPCRRCRHFLPPRVPTKLKTAPRSIMLRFAPHNRVCTPAPGSYAPAVASRGRCGREWSATSIRLPSRKSPLANDLVELFAERSASSSATGRLRRRSGCPRSGVQSRPDLCVERGHHAWPRRTSITLACSTSPRRRLRPRA